MTMDKDIIVAIKLSLSSCKQIDERCLDDLTAALNDCPQQAGHQEGSRDDLLLLRFKKLATAYASLFGCFKRIKQEQNWNLSGDRLPVQIIFHNPTKYIDLPDNICAPDSNIWALLENEVLYVDPFPQKRLV
jgi:hypothetical protein